MIGGGSRRKNRGQWDGWRLEKAIKRPAGEFVFNDIDTIRCYTKKVLPL